jgi:hypothetical protein
VWQPRPNGSTVSLEPLGRATRQFSGVIFSNTGVMIFRNEAESHTFFDDLRSVFDRIRAQSSSGCPEENVFAPGSVRRLQFASSRPLEEAAGPGHQASLKLSFTLHDGTTRADAHAVTESFPARSGRGNPRILSSPEGALDRATQSRANHLRSAPARFGKTHPSRSATGLLDRATKPKSLASPGTN